MKQNKIFVLLLIIAIAQTLWYGKGETIINSTQGALLPQTWYPVISAFQAWQPLYGGSVNLPFSILWLPFAVSLNTVLVVFGSNAYWFAYVLLLLSLGEFGMYLLCRELGASEFSSLAIAVMFIGFNAALSTYAGDAMLPFFLLALLKLYREAEKGKITTRTKAFLIISLGLFVVIEGVTFAIASIAFISVLVIVLLLSLKNRVLFLRMLIIALALVMLMDATGEYALYLQYANFGAQYLNQNSFNLLLTSAQPIAYSLVGFNPLYSEGFVTPNPIPIFSIIVLCLFLIEVYLLFAKQKWKSNEHFLLGLFLAFILIVIIGATVTPPFGIIFNSLLVQFSFLDGLRAIFVVLTPFYLVSPLVFISLLFSKIPRPLVLLFLLLFLFAYDYSNIPVSGGIQSVPQSVHQLSNYINSQPGNFNVGELPPTITTRATKLYNGVDIYSSLIYNHSVFTGGDVAYGASQTPLPNNYYYYYNIAGQISDNLSANVSQMQSGLSSLGIKYLLVEGSVFNATLYNTTSPQFSYTTIFYNINRMKNVKYVANFGGDALYENTNYTSNGTSETENQQQICPMRYSSCVVTVTNTNDINTLQRNLNISWIVSAVGVVLTAAYLIRQGKNQRVVKNKNSKN